MGDMADMYDDELYRDYDYLVNDHWISHDKIREIRWKTRENELIKIKDMGNRHLLNAYKLSGDEDLFAEMVVRLFEQMVSRG
jgi:hypothetical protein